MKGKTTTVFTFAPRGASIAASRAVLSDARIGIASSQCVPRDAMRLSGAESGRRVPAPDVLLIRDGLEVIGPVTSPACTAPRSHMVDSQSYGDWADEALVGITVHQRERAVRTNGHDSVAIAVISALPNPAADLRAVRRVEIESFVKRHAASRNLREQRIAMRFPPSVVHFAPAANVILPLASFDDAQPHDRSITESRYSWYG